MKSKQPKENCIDLIADISAVWGYIIPKKNNVLDDKRDSYILKLHFV